MFILTSLLDTLFDITLSGRSSVLAIASTTRFELGRVGQSNRLYKTDCFFSNKMSNCVKISRIGNNNNTGLSLSYMYMIHCLPTVLKKILLTMKIMYTSHK